MKPILHWTPHSGPQPTTDELATEEPLEIQLDTHPVSVTMRTPGHDDELAVGFLLGEGVLRTRAELQSLKPYWRNEAGNVMGVFLAPDAKVDYSRFTRHVFASSSCGLCGKAAIESIHQHFPPVKADFTLPAQVLLRLPEQLRQHQSTFQRTGGLHAAAIFTAEGELVVLREDIGRHNAVDKVLGYGLLHDLLPFERHILMVSGRTSFEILQKALAGRVPIVAAISAPSSLAVDFAAANGQTLVGFLRDQRMNLYAHPERIQFTQPDLSPL